MTSDLTPKSCEECARKEKVIGQLYEKMEGLEEAVDAFCKDQQRQLVREKSMGMGQSNQQQLQVNLDQVIKNVSELNHLVTENEKEVQYDLAGRVNSKIFDERLITSVFGKSKKSCKNLVLQRRKLVRILASLARKAPLKNDFFIPLHA